MAVALPKKAVGPRHLAMDSTGLNIYGDGEWKVRMHSNAKRRTWRNLHGGVDAASGASHAAGLTENRVRQEALAEPR